MTTDRMNANRLWPCVPLQFTKECEPASRYRWLISYLQWIAHTGIP